MIDAPFLLSIIIIMPLLLAVGVVVSVTQRVAIKIAPWAALPALLAGLLLDDGKLQLPGMLINSYLLFDHTGRLFLLMSAILWLATGLLHQAHSGALYAQQKIVFKLLAMTGCFFMSLAGDVLMFMTATTLTGYSLYGLLAQEKNTTTREAVNVMLVVLVVSDIVLFELLQLLGMHAVSVDFIAMRQAFVITEQMNVQFGLLLFGLGAKIGLLGLHFWLIPVFITSHLALRPALISFVFSAGFIGWLRLFPLGEVHYPAIGELLQWGAWLMLGYALLLGVRQIHRRGVLAVLLMIVTALWLSIVAAILIQPELWLSLNRNLVSAVTQMGLVLSALMIGQGLHKHKPAWKHRYALTLWLAIFLLTVAPISLVSHFVSVNSLTVASLWIGAGLMMFILWRTHFMLLAAAEASSKSGGHKMRHTDSSVTHYLFSGLVLVGLMTAVPNLKMLSMFTVFSLFLLLGSMLVLAWLTRFYKPTEPSQLMSGFIMQQFKQGRSMIMEMTQYLDIYSNRLQKSIKKRFSPIFVLSHFSRYERSLNRWSVALIIMVLIGLLVSVQGLLNQ
ncbi:MAG: hypothetical protein OQL27_08925 [Sedimenticola sp.]|nr:hypothetical protein [Sedimenticola sp.]